MRRSAALLRSTSLYSLLVFSSLLIASNASAFDPNEGEVSAPTTMQAPANLPSTRALTGETPRNTPSVAFPQIITSGSASNLPPIQFNPATTPPLVATPPAVYFPKVDAAMLQHSSAAISSPSATAPAATTLNTSPATPALPNVAPLDATAPTPTGFIAPAPLMAMPASTPITAPATAVGAAPVATAPIVSQNSVTPAVTPVAPAPAGDALTPKSKTILKTIPSRIDTPPVEKTTHLNVSRISARADMNKNKDAVESYESTGIKIAVKKPGVDTNQELTDAYNDISGGDAANAIESYKRVLSADPLNQDALFGLASIYHRQGQVDKARPLYGILLKNYPNNRDGLNNFLVLISDEAPQEALNELQKLEQRNPDFSPIPAQEALVLNKLGYVKESRDKMIRAIEISPDNLTYKYNLAVMFDSQGDYESAAAIYRDLLVSANNGATLPISTDALQKRLNFIAQQRTGVVKAQ